VLDEWAACMRRHGDPNQADPTITANKLIDIPWNPATLAAYTGRANRAAPALAGSSRRT
jgi:hypothetical protein